jgi:hypothetical protein
MSPFSGGFMRGVMLFLAGLFAGLAIHSVMAQTGNGGVVMINHVGISVSNVAEARFRKSGVTVSDTNTSDTKAIFANITDPYMGRIELTELTPEPLHYKAVQNWK